MHAQRSNVSDDLAIAETDDPLALFGDIGLMGDQHDGAPFFIQPREDPQDVLGCMRVEVPGRLVSEHQRRVGHNRPCHSHTLLLAAGEL